MWACQLLPQLAGKPTSHARSMRNPSAASHTIDSFPDTQRFLELLAHLDDPPHGEHELLERRAARGLFDWEASCQWGPVFEGQGGRGGWRCPGLLYGRARLSEGCLLARQPPAAGRAARRLFQTPLEAMQHSRVLCSVMPVRVRVPGRQGAVLGRRGTAAQ